MIRKAVVLAAGRGTRMQRRAADDPALSPEQEEAAAAGQKALMPVGRPLLDYVLSALADAGITDICIVVAPGASPIAQRYAVTAPPSRMRVVFAVQSTPRGTADALLSAREFVGDDAFLVLNADNYYPVSVIKHLAGCGAPCVAAFGARTLIEHGNIPPSRIAAYALLDVAPDGVLADIVEKPGAVPPASSSDSLVGMNLWAFTPEIFSACEDVAPSPRGELELPQAVRLAVRERGMRVRTVTVAEGVLDLSSRADVASVAERLRGVRVVL